MRKLLALLLLPAVGGCALLSGEIQNPINYNQLGGVESAYGIALSAAVAYRNLPLCRTGTVSTVTAVCAQRSIILKLQAADLTAENAIQAANAFVAANPTLSASAVITAAESALAGFQAIEAAYGIH
jgi:hypothetical protein